MSKILELKLSLGSKEELNQTLLSFLDKSKLDGLERAKFIITPNPEIILRAQKDKEYLDILNQADLSLADGFGLKIAATLFGFPLTRVTGADTTTYLLNEAEKREQSIAIINWQAGLSSSQLLEKTLKEKYPKLKFLIIETERTDNLSEDLINKINEFSPQILFCTLGFPYQEKLIYNSLERLKSLKLAIGVGGSFDFITGQTKRAPKWLRRLGLEWFWRLIIQPKRYKRIFQATFVFLFKVFQEKFKSIFIKKDTMRNNEKKARLRFAPSPTGFLHIGNLRTVLFTYLIAKSLQGELVLRIEDTDQEREVPGAIDSLISILDWLGIAFDEGPGIAGDYGPYIQTERLDIYKKLTKELLDLDGAYHCFCTKERLAEMRQEQEARKQAPRYDRKCRDLRKDEVEAKIKAGETYVIRQKMPLEGTISVYDELRGEIKFSAEDIDDQVLIKSNGVPTYHFANIVDDYLMKITHVSRGDEWLPSFPKNILLYRAFGWPEPKYIHLPLILNKEGGKLSKRQGDVFVEQFRDKGYLKEALLNFTALLGWRPKGKEGDEELMSFEELKQKFSWQDLGISPAVFDIAKLDYFNAHYIRQKSSQELLELSRPYLKDLNLNDDLALKYLSISQDRLKKLSDINEYISFLIKLNDYEAELLIWRKSNFEDTLNNLNLLKNKLEGLEFKLWQKENLEQEIMTWLKDNNYQNGDFLWPMRVALAGLKNSPGPFEIAWALGREESLNRINLAINKLATK